MKTPTNPLEAMLKALADAMMEETAIEFKAWMAQSDAPEIVKQEFVELTNDIDDQTLGMITLAATNWARAVLKEKVQHEIEVRAAKQRVEVARDEPLA